MRSERDIADAIERHADTVRRLCMVYLKNHADTDDVFQTVFLSYATSDVSFQNPEHERAWFVRVTVNACKDSLRSMFRKATVPIDEVLELSSPIPEDHREVLEAVLALPKQYREVIYLHFYERYTAPQIASLLGRNVNTVYTLINRAKARLRRELEESEVEHGR